MNRYEVVGVPARVGKRLLTLITHAIGPAFLAAGKEPDVMTVLAGVMERVKDADLDALIDAFAPLTTVHLTDGKSPRLNAIFDEHFAGNYQDMLAWLLFCLEVNYSGFFAELRSARAPSP
jgi:hypothetical protein